MLSELMLKEKSQYGIGQIRKIIVSSQNVVLNQTLRLNISPPAEKSNSF